MKEGFVTALPSMKKKTRRVNRPHFDLLAFLAIGIAAAAVGATGNPGGGAITGSADKQVLSTGKIVGNQGVRWTNDLLSATSPLSAIDLPVTFEKPKRTELVISLAQAAQTTRQFENDRSVTPINYLFNPTETLQRRLQQLAAGLQGIGGLLAYEGDEQEFVLEAGPPGHSLSIFLHPSRTLAMYRARPSFDLDSLTVVKLPKYPSLGQVMEIAGKYLESVNAHQVAHDVA